jgi:GAF domain-containing protein
VIGWVTANAKTRISQDVDRDPFHFRNPLLPDTQSEMAVPLIVGESLIGALDVQSKDRNAFTEDDVRMIETIADELAVAIENARLLRDSRQQLKRFESAYREQARQSWSRIASMFDETEVYFGAGEGGEEAQFETIAAASRSGEVVLSEDRREIAVPVRMRDDIIAAIAARKSQEGEQWEQEDVAMLQAVAAQTALALEGARRYAEEHRRVAELEVVNRVSQAVSQHLRLDSLYRVVHNQINQVLGETDMYIAISHPETEQIAFPYISENKEMIQREPAPFGKGLASLIIQTRQPLLLQEDTERRASALGTEILGKEAKSWLGVPLIVGDDVIGVLSVQDPAVENRFTEDDAALLTTLASQVATALQSAQLLDQVQRSARRERLIHQIASKVRRAPDVKTVLETTATELRRALNASGAAIRLDREPRALGDESSPTGEETLNSEEKSSPEEPVA